jgi:hypothetical protein
MVVDILSCTFNLIRFKLGTRAQRKFLGMNLVVLSSSLLVNNSVKMAAYMHNAYEYVYHIKTAKPTFKQKLIGSILTWGKGRM